MPMMWLPRHPARSGARRFGERHRHRPRQPRRRRHEIPATWKAPIFWREISAAKIRHRRPRPVFYTIERIRAVVTPRINAYDYLTDRFMQPSYKDPGLSPKNSE